MVARIAAGAKGARQDSWGGAPHVAHATPEKHRRTPRSALASGRWSDPKGI